MSHQKLRGIIFDFNGVIVDDYPLQKEAWSRVSQIIRQRPVTDEEMLHNIRGVPSRDTVAWMAAGTLTEQQVDELAQTKTAITKELFDTGPFLRLTPGLVAFLDELRRQNVLRTIATSQTADTFRPLFNKLGLGRWFDWQEVICHDETYPGKPAPDAYYKAAQVLGVSPEACVVVEDARSGILAAYAAGVRTIVVVAPGEHHQELRRLPGVVKIIRDFTELHASALLLQ